MNGSSTTWHGLRVNATDRQPWWHNPWNVGSLAVCLVVIGFSTGFFVGGADAQPDHPGEDSVDVGFLRDMAIHHDQAIAMAYIYLDKDTPEDDKVIRTIAYEIARNQQYEVGIMVQALAGWGYVAQNPDEVVMRWMGMALPEEQMPGMASDEQIDALRAATGSEATDLFIELMVAHHEAGAAMADFAAERAETGTTENLARNFAAAQRGEIAELAELAGG